MDVYKVPDLIQRGRVPNTLINLWVSAWLCLDTVWHAPQPLSREVVKRTSLATGIFTLLLILIAWLIASLVAFGSSAATGNSGSAVSGTVLSGNDTNYDKANDAQAQPLSNDHRDNSLARRMDPVVPFLYFQSISSSGLLSLNYPAVYLSFTVSAI